MDPKRAIRKTSRMLLNAVWPNQRLKRTKEGVIYLLVWLGLLGLGIHQQNNLVLVASGLLAGPAVSSIFASAAMLKRLGVERRGPRFVFSGQPLIVDYVLANQRRFMAALAITIEDELLPQDRNLAGAARFAPKVFIERAPARAKVRARWQAIAPGRGRYRFRSLEIITGFPFGLMERRLTPSLPPQSLVVYPEVGRMSHRWRRLTRQVSETRRGQRHERSQHQQEYHGLREFRPGDSLRHIHWRTTARIGLPMVKEFEVRHDQDLAILLDPWLPRHQATPEQREAVEHLVKFAATLCLETCKRQGRRLLVGCTGVTPAVWQGSASIRLLHELLEELAVLKPIHEGDLAGLFDVAPAAALREAFLVVVSTRPINLAEQAQRSSKLTGVWTRGSINRAVVLNVSKGELNDYFELGGDETRRAEAVATGLAPSTTPAASSPAPPPTTSREVSSIPARSSSTANGNGDSSKHGAPVASAILSAEGLAAVDADTAESATTGSPAPASSGEGGRS